MYHLDWTLDSINQENLTWSIPDLLHLTLESHISNVDPGPSTLVSFKRVAEEPPMEEEDDVRHLRRRMMIDILNKRLVSESG